MTTRLIVSDIDGCLTDGAVYVDANGVESCKYSRVDGHGVRMARDAGIEVKFITLENSPCHRHRADKLGVRITICIDKMDAFPMIADEKEFAYFGDDLSDLDPMRMAAIVGCPMTAHKSVYDYVTERGGFVSGDDAGAGAFRAFVEFVLCE